MSKLLTWLTTALLAVALLLCALGGIASLDEFARLPFYNTLPFASLLINGTFVVLLWHNKKHIDLVEQVYQGLALFNRISLRRPVISRTSERRERSTGAPSFRQTETRRMRMPSSREIEIALGRVHSIAWGFPVPKRTFKTLGREESSNREARQ